MCLYKNSIFASCLIGGAAFGQAEDTFVMDSNPLIFVLFVSFAAQLHNCCIIELPRHYCSLAQKITPPSCFPPRFVRYY